MSFKEAPRPASIIGVKTLREVTDQEYNEYYKKYKACLHKSCRDWASRLGDEEAIQIAGIALWRAMQSYDATRKTNFLSYLTHCLRWTFLDVGKKEKHQGIAADISDHDAVFYQDEYDDRPEVLMNRLSDRSRKVISLVQAGKNPTEISKEMGVSRQRIHQIFGEVRDLRIKLTKTGKF